MGQSIKSIYKPSHPEKYLGNSNNIICRSSWERQFCRYCDVNPNIVKWASEEFSIPYISPVDGRPHRYYPDFLIEVKEKSGKLKKYVKNSIIIPSSVTADIQVVEIFIGQIFCDILEDKFLNT